MTGPARPPGLILAGGRSSRMGEDKTTVLLAGKPLIFHVVDRLKPQTQTLVIAGPPALERLTGLPAIADARPGFAGPLAGLLAGLLYIRARFPDETHLLTTPADTPFLPPDLVEKLGAKAGPRPVVAGSRERLHPVAALWPVALADPLGRWLDSGRKPRLMDFIAETGFESVAFPDPEMPGGGPDPFLNVNTPQDLEDAKSFLLREEE